MIKRSGFKILLLLLLLPSLLSVVKAQAPRALVVIAHPDDESMLSVTLYKLAKEQHGVVDLFVITNGEAGYRYSSLAEKYYGCQLTDATNARKRLPAIRKQELKEAGHVLGVAHYYFGGQPDSHFSLDEHEPLDTSWNVPAIRKQLSRLLTTNHYDYVFCLLPEAGTHAGHKAATLLALDAVAVLPANKRPVILGTALRDKAETPHTFTALPGYPNTKVESALPDFSTDRTSSFSYQNRINYKVIANWELAAHKSQGATQMTMNVGDLEEFWSFAINNTQSHEKSNELFGRLKQIPGSAVAPQFTQLSSTR